jgi:3-dehydroquinate dehydratase/shikimate dehydrogenase
MLFVSLNEYQEIDRSVEIRKDFRKTAFPTIFKLNWKDNNLLEVVAQQPEYIDLDEETPLELLQSIKKKSPSVKIILSHHSFQKGDFQEILNRLTQKPADFYKIALFCPTALEALSLMRSPIPQPLQGKIIRIPMGEEGSFIRFLGPIVGNPIDYCCLSEEERVAPGQWDLKTMTEVFHYERLNPQTALYGLIGDPVSQSMSHIIHNAAIRERNLNALYVKIRLRKEELGEFFSLVKALPFKGFSVTMPLKEAVIPYLDVLDLGAQQMGSVNTIVRKADAFMGFNTDGMGALNALEKHLPVKGKRVVILGAGGASRAIAFEAKKRGAVLTILNRTAARAKALGDLFQVSWGGFEKIPEYDILINTTSVGMAPHVGVSPISHEAISASSVVFDIISNPVETELLKSAKLKGCKTVPGKEMFLEQGALQYGLWF